MQDNNRVVLRSSENDQFHPWKIFLSMSSPVLSNMLPDRMDGPDDCPDEPPIIDVDMSSRTLRHVLSLCHPPGYFNEKQFQLGSIAELRDVLDATAKYEMDQVHRAALETLLDPSLVRDDPLAAYVLACQYERREAAQLAVKHTLALPRLVQRRVPGLEQIHAGHLFRLLLYREACTTAACALAADRAWFVYTKHASLFRHVTGWGEGETDMAWITLRHPPSRKYQNGRLESMLAYKWWIAYVSKSEYALQRWPHGDAVKEAKLVDDALDAISSLKDASHVRDSFQSFVQAFAEEIDRRVAEVKIDLEF